ncbi:hypothetical protein E1B28_004571 [Marasmius oreades]|uniref:non-specific serine/threonine protein kinase n=1 Tax=Marasmius oreades TaxID=181124 RepID=A0A9P8ADD1_9AGAR|nr:uncharacterized protein E1B28_004571 [Marasmius oreades]KAG7097200.1 hypothetical protein E1B28_004571 [Marasmius oreades]
MLGTRTKRVNAYGKRSQRIINVSEEGAITHTRRAPAPSIFDDMPPTQRVAVASKMKNRENAVIKKPKYTSPKLITKKQSPLRQRAMSKMIHQQNPTQINHQPPPPTPSRAPLATYIPNIPNSPASGTTIYRKPKLSTQGMPVRRSIKPFVDTDIILLDNDGHTVSHERRISQPSTDANPPAGPSCSSESESDIQLPRKATRPHKKANYVVELSDDESSSEDEIQIRHSTRKSAQAHVTTRPSVHFPKTAVKVEVVIPPPPSPLDRLIRDTSSPGPSSDAHVQPSPKKYQRTLSPIIRPRQLTPLRPHRKALLTPPSPPSPLTDSELDIDLELSDLGLGPSVDVENPPTFPDHLRSLLEECQQVQSGLYEFSAFIDTFPYDAVLSLTRIRTALDKHKFRKVGEASYSEVFGIGDVVLKVIPIRDETIDPSTATSETDGPFPSDAKDVLKEIIVTRAMGAVDESFVKLLRTYVVKGKYPQVLLQLWDEYLEKNGSESVRPDTFGVSQAYVIIALPDGGPDLEAFRFSNASKTGWRQASSIFWQVTKALAHGEQLVSFEHRDLHWGQILIQSIPTPVKMPMGERVNQVAKIRSPRVNMDDPLHGIRVTLIDLGLARMDAGDGAGGEMVHWTPFDDELFMGQGDYQFDVYRLMKEQHRDHWEAFNPLTNVMWLHYLLVKLLQCKRLKPPVVAKKGQISSQHSSTTSFSEKQCYDCLVDLERWLGECVAHSSARARASIKGAGKKKAKNGTMQQVSLSPLCAGEIVEYGIKKGWISSTATT